MHRLLSLLFFLLALPIATTVIQTQPVSAHTQQTTCTNIPANPDYLSSGRASDAVAAINYARQREHVHALKLPSNFYQLSPIKQQFTLVNAERVDRGLKPLLLSTTLSQMSQNYSQQMVTQHFFSHTSPKGVTFMQRINNNPAVRNHYLTVAENIGGNPVAGAGSIYEYMYDDAAAGCGHRANILMPQLTHIGIGVTGSDLYGSISTQDFLASAPWNPYRG